MIVIVKVTAVQEPMAEGFSGLLSMTATGDLAVKGDPHDRTQTSRQNRQS
jgi:hypothetical protein